VENNTLVQFNSTVVVERAASTVRWPVTERAQHSNTVTKDNKKDTYETNTIQTYSRILT